MRRRAVLAGLAGLLLAPLPAQAQPSAREIPRVGVLTPQAAAEPPSLQREPFEQGLRELGWTPGSNILIDYRYAEGDAGRLAELAADLVRQKVDIIVVRGSQAARAARNATSTIPIVMSVTPDPVGSGLVASLARPGGNITGLSFLAGGSLEAKQLELLKEAMPGLTRVAILANPLTSRDPAGSFAREIDAAAGSLGLDLKTFEIRAPSDLPEAFAAMARASAGAVLVRTDPQILEPHHAQVMALTRQHRLPAIFGWRNYVEAGGLMSYGASLPELHRRSAAFVDKILKGAKPSELPVEQPVKYELVVNGRVARDLGLTLPQPFFARADEVIE